MNGSKSPPPGTAIDDYIRVRVAMIAAEKISAGMPPERAVAEALAEIRTVPDVRYAAAISESLGIKSREAL